MGGMAKEQVGATAPTRNRFRNNVPPLALLTLAVLSLTALLMLLTIQMESASFRYRFTTASRAPLLSRTPEGTRGIVWEGSWGVREKVWGTASSRRPGRRCYPVPLNQE